MANPSNPVFASSPVPPPFLNLPWGELRSGNQVYLSIPAIQFLQELWAAIQGQDGILDQILTLAFSPGLTVSTATALIDQLAAQYALAAIPPQDAGAILAAVQDMALAVQRPPPITPAAPVATAPTAWTPTIAIGGAATGITYTTQAGTIEYLTPYTARLRLLVLMSSKGALAGAVSITNLPVPLSTAWGSADGGIVPTFSNFTGLTGPMFVAGVGASTTLNLQQGTATGVAAVTDVNLTNTSTFQVALDVSY